MAASWMDLSPVASIPRLALWQTLQSLSSALLTQLRPLCWGHYLPSGVNTENTQISWALPRYPEDLKFEFSLCKFLPQ